MNIPATLQGLIVPCYCAEARDLADKLSAAVMETQRRITGSPPLPLKIECNLCHGRGTLLTTEGRQLAAHLTSHQ